MSEQCMHDGKAGPCERPAVEGEHFCRRHLPKAEWSVSVLTMTGRSEAKARAVYEAALKSLESARMGRVELRRNGVQIKGVLKA